MIKFSEIALLDAVAQGNSRFKSLRNVKYRHTVSKDQYSVEMAVVCGGEWKILKILLEPNGERAQEIISTAKVLERLDLSFVVKTTVYEKELTVITTDNQMFVADVILIDDITTPIFDVEKDGDENEIVNGYLNLVKEILHKGYIFDLISKESFRYDGKNVLLSLDTNFIFDGVVNSDRVKNRAFCNFLIMIYLRMLAEEHNVITVSDRIIHYEKNFIRFDQRILNNFVSPEYRKDILAMMKLLERYGDYDCSKLRDSIDLMNNSDTISALFQIARDDERVELYSYIGNHYEDRIVVCGTSSAKFGYVNFDWEDVIDFKYDFATDFVEGVAVCKIGELYGAINRFGETIVPFEYEFLEWHSERNLFIWRKDGQTTDETQRCDFLK